MTDAEKAALAWIDEVASRQPGDLITITHSEKHARTLKAMLAEPRLPAEPSDTAINAMMQHGWDAKAIYRALYTHLTRKPPKIVWRVQPEGWPFEDFEAIYTATARASHWLAQDIEVSIRKTQVKS